MASWLDILSQNYTDQRGRLNPFALARGFTRKGREEIDLSRNIDVGGQQDELAAQARRRAALGFMQSRPNPMTTVPTTPEESSILAGLLSTEGQRGDVRAQGLALDSGRLALSTAQQTQPAAIEEPTLRNRALRAQIADTSSLTGARESLLPGQIVGQQQANRGAELANTEFVQMSPRRLSAADIANQISGFNLDRSQQLMLGELENQYLTNEQTRESLVEQIAGQNARLQGLDLGVDIARQNLSEARDTAPIRQQILRNQTALSPQLRAYLDVLPNVGPLMDPSGQLQKEVQSRLGMAPYVQPSDGRAEALRQAVEASRSATRYSPSPAPAAPVTASPASTSSQTPSERQNQVFRKAMGSVGRGIVRGADAIGVTNYTEDDVNIMQQLLQSPEGRAKIQQLWPTLDESTKARLAAVIERVKGQ